LTACAIFLATAGPAAADGVGPTNYRSVITSVTPRTEGVEVKVLGEDSFLQVTAQRGRTVEIPGYDGEPYLRIDKDGKVERNKNSVASYINNSRSGRVDIPEGVNSATDPAWDTISTNGSVAWHDHRIHYMASGTPTVGSDRVVQDWVVPLTVDGNPVEVEGTLLRNDNVLPWAGLLAIAAGAGALLFLRKFGQGWAGGLMGAAAVLALGISISIAVLNPPGSGASPLPLILPVLALFAGISTRFIPSGKPPVFRLATLLAAVALLIGWVVPIIGVLWMPNIPSTLPESLIRIGVGLALGTAVGTAVAVLVWPEAPAGSSTGSSTAPNAHPPAPANS
ncbi:MAG TPA: hypothetical protein VL068_08760, partial [Microthrixaceae bacterium]|nr:hypothetical protein [Microthrixaceae bacterium]